MSTQNAYVHNRRKPHTAYKKKTCIETNTRCEANNIFIILFYLVFICVILYRRTGCLSSGPHDTLGCFTPESWDRFQYSLTALKPTIAYNWCTCIHNNSTTRPFSSKYVCGLQCGGLVCGAHYANVYFCICVPIYVCSTL